MKVGAYQFAVTGDIEKNTELIVDAISQAAAKQVRLLVFPECALTGYPPYDIANPSQIDDQKVMESLSRIQKVVEQAGMYEIDGLRIGVRICFEVRFRSL